MPIEYYDEQDEVLYKKAKEIVIAEQKAMASLLQRKLKVGYAHAARLLDMLEEDGIIGPPDGARPRKVLAPKLGDYPQPLES